MVEQVTPREFGVQKAAKLNALFDEKLNLTGGTMTGDLQVNGATLTPLFLVDVSNDSVHIGNSLTTGSGDGDLILANTNRVRWINGAGTDSGAGVGGSIHLDSGDSLVANFKTNFVFRDSAGGTTHLLSGAAGAGVVFNESGADINFRVEGDTLDHLLFVDAGNESIHINNSLLTGSSSGSLVFANNNWLRWINTAGTSSATFGIRGNANDDLIYNVPAAGDKHKFRSNGTDAISIVVENSGGGIEFVAESSADHTAPAANGCVLYTKDNGAGKTQLMAIFSSGAAQQVAIQP